MDRFDKELGFYKARIAKAREVVKGLPKGEFQIAKNGTNSYRWRVKRYRRDLKKTVREEIKKSDEALAADLALRTYLEKLIDDDCKEIENIERFQKNHVEEPHGFGNINCRAEFLRLLALRIGEFTNEWDAECEKWANEPYDKYTLHSDELICDTDCGIKVRTKSEADIADQLYSMHIPFRYEQNTMINGHKYAPDFTIMHPVTHEIYIWEHFGQLDDEGYLYEHRYKLFNYANAGWYIGINLIVTSETKSHPFTRVKARDEAIRFFG